MGLPTSATETKRAVDHGELRLKLLQFSAGAEQVDGVGLRGGVGEEHATPQARATSRAQGRFTGHPAARADRSRETGPEGREPCSTHGPDYRVAAGRWTRSPLPHQPLQEGWPLARLVGTVVLVLLPLESSALCGGVSPGLVR